MRKISTDKNLKIEQIFNSDYFHETDKINFKDSYEARRINITYLFGDRLFKKKTK